MSKYIDADQIRAEIERQKEINKKVLDGQLRDGCLYAFNQVLSFLDTLPEQPVEGLDVTDFCKPVDPGIAKCVADHWWELLDDENAADKKAVKEIVKTVHKEVTRQVKEMIDKLPVDGLEEAAEESWAEYEYRETPQGLYSSCYKDGFIAGSEWQEKQTPLPEDTTIFLKGVAEGRRLEKDDNISLIESRTAEILGDAQPAPILRTELRELITKIKEEKA